jgi:hypothetical protein
LNIGSGHAPEPPAVGLPKEDIVNSTESLAYVKSYFHEVFDKRNINAIDYYFDKDYFDDDIGDPSINHIENSKKFLSDLFNKNPNIGVNVVNAIEKDGVISSFVEWYDKKDNDKGIIRKGIVIFVMRNEKILHRHTFIYFEK